MLLLLPALRFHELTNADGTSGTNSKDRLQKGRRIRAQDPHPLESMFLQVICEATGPVCEFSIASTEGLAVGCDMKDGFGLIAVRKNVQSESWGRRYIRLDVRGPRQEGCWREGVQVVMVGGLVGRDEGEQVGGDLRETRLWAGHGLYLLWTRKGWVEW